MAVRYHYDASQEPPAPVLPVRVSRPGDARAVLLGGLIDTGADITVLPEEVPGALGLPVIGSVAVRGVGGVARTAALHAAAVAVAGREEIVEIVALGSEALLGRDLLNRWVLTLDGPRTRLRVSAT